MAFNCDVFIYLTDSNISSEDDEESENIYDYYKSINNHVLNQKLENKGTLITKGLIVIS